ncbi:MULTISPECIES: DUF3592 domain-containing protein [unclassified Paraburkholderia]|uniref:DUF3592 domain-containing protein n=1 Tax=unclassified Paraburkholderia TaxID=2615204 RepID=UPI002AB29315|nr:MULTISPECIES: DUF3592 domain-containing protein [unclassified Paraburkholderia]
MAENFEKTRSIFGALIAFLAAVVFLFSAVSATSDTLDFLRSSTLVSGRVVDLPHGPNHPKITFITKAGEQVSYTQNGFDFDMGVGDEVQVRYLPEDPKSSARLDRVGAMWESSIGWGILSIGFAIYGTVCLLKLRRDRFKENSR